MGCTRVANQIEVEFNDGIKLVFGEIKFKDVARLMKKYAKPDTLNDTSGFTPETIDFLFELVKASIHEYHGIEDLDKWLSELPYSEFLKLVEYAIKVNPLLQGEIETGS